MIDYLLAFFSPLALVFFLCLFGCVGFLGVRSVFLIFSERRRVKHWGDAAKLLHLDLHKPHWWDLFWSGQRTNLIGKSDDFVIFLGGSGENLQLQIHCDIRPDSLGLKSRLRPMLPNWLTGANFPAQTGDLDFDRLYELRGEPEEWAPFLDAEVRDAFAQLLRLDSVFSNMLVEFREGSLMCRLPEEAREQLGFVPVPFRKPEAYIQRALRALKLLQDPPMERSKYLFSLLKTETLLPVQKAIVDFLFFYEPESPETKDLSEYLFADAPPALRCWGFERVLELSEAPFDIPQRLEQIVRNEEELVEVRTYALGLLEHHRSLEALFALLSVCIEDSNAAMGKYARKMRARLRREQPETFQGRLSISDDAEDAGQLSLHEVAGDLSIVKDEL